MRQFAHFYLSHGMDFTDVLIASVAVRLAMPLYTLNLKHYQPLPSIVQRRQYDRLIVPHETIYPVSDARIAGRIGIRL